MLRDNYNIINGKCSVDGLELVSVYESSNKTLAFNNFHIFELKRGETIACLTHSQVQSLTLSEDAVDSCRVLRGPHSLSLSRSLSFFLYIHIYIYI